MGLADLVPGVSGGTIALLYGIYDELLYSIKVVTGEVPRLILKGKINDAIKATPFAFIIPLSFGVFAAIFGAVQIITYLLEQFPTYTWSVFFGLIVGSSYFVARRIEQWNMNRCALMVLGFAVTYIVVGLPALNAPVTPATLFGTGAIAICAMILPGISGSLIMVLLGQYENVLRAVSEFDISKLLAFATGAIVGLAVFSRILSWLLHNHHSATVAFLIGVMIGSLRKVWPWQQEVSHGSFSNYLPDVSWVLLLHIFLATAGFLLVWQLEKQGIAREHEDIDDNDFKREIHTQHD